MKEVRSGLFIGDAKDADAVLSSSNHGITHVLSLLVSTAALHGKPSADGLTEEFGLELHLAGPDHLQITRLWVPWQDTEGQNILDSLEHCLDFIEQGRQKSSVLVHCLAGVSRSAAAVTAYLMKSEHLPLQDALSSLQITSKNACPNIGFLDQLKLFEHMGFKVDCSSPIYKKFHVEKLGEAYGEGKKIVQSCFAVDPALKPSLSSQDSEVQKQIELSSVLLYRCKKCRRILACQENVLTHDQGNGNAPYNKKEKVCLWDEIRTVDCTSIFVEPMRWMATVQEGGVMGKLSCATCEARLGSFNWAGAQCSCGAWVVPAFQLHKSRMDACKF